MGTSKGYIIPTKKHWSDAKRAATQLSKENNLNNRIKMANKFVNAMKIDNNVNVNSAYNAIARIIGLSQSLSSKGVSQTLKDLNKNDLLNKSSNEALESLIAEYSEYGNTKDNYLAMDAVSIALKELEINNLEQLADISIEILLKEILINFVDLNFKFRFEEQIIKRNPVKANKIIEDMSGYIKNKLRNEFNVSDILNVDFNNLSNNKIIEEKILDAYNVFKELYEEE